MYMYMYICIKHNAKFTTTRTCTLHSYSKCITSPSPISDRLLWVNSRVDSCNSLDGEVLWGLSSVVLLLFWSLLCPKMTLNTGSSAGEVWFRALVDAVYRFEQPLELLASIPKLGLWAVGISFDVCWPGASSMLLEDEFSARSVDTARLSQAVRTNVSNALVFGALEVWCSDSVSSSSEVDEPLKKWKT